MDGKFVRLINESVQKYFCVSASMGRHYCIFKKNVMLISQIGNVTENETGNENNRETQGGLL